MALSKRKNRQLAVALGFDLERDSSPKVVAKGEGKVAEKIIELAKQNGVPVRTDEDLVQSLAQIDLGHAIPPKLYAAVSEVLAYVYRMGQRKKGRGW